MNSISVSTIGFSFLNTPSYSTNHSQSRGGFEQLLNSANSQIQTQNITGTVSTGGLSNISWFTVDGSADGTDATAGTTTSRTGNFAAVGCQVETPDGDYAFAASAVNIKKPVNISGTFGDGDGAFSAHLDANGKSTIEVLARADGGNNDSLSSATLSQDLSLLFAEIKNELNASSSGAHPNMGMIAQ